MNSKNSSIVSPIITLVVLTILVSTDVYLHIKNLNQRIFNVDMEINNIIQDFESNYKDKKPPAEKLMRKKQKQKMLSKEFAYY